MRLKNGVYYNAKNNKIYLVTDLLWNCIAAKFCITDGSLTETVVQYSPEMLDYVIYLGEL